MKVIILGALGWFDNEIDHTLSIYVQNTGTLFDIGSGIFRLANITLPQTLRIFISHLHLDHVANIIAISRVFHGKELHIYCPRGSKKHLLALHAPPYFGRTLNSYKWKLYIHEVSSGDVISFVSEKGNPVKVEAQEFPHAGGSVLGYKLLYNGKKLVFITDTRASEEEIEFIKEADLLLHECFHPDEDEETAIRQGHTTPTLLGKIAQKAGVKKVVLIHLHPLKYNIFPKYLKEIRKVFPNAILGKGGMELEV